MRVVTQVAENRFRIKQGRLVKEFVLTQRAGLYYYQIGTTGNRVAAKTRAKERAIEIVNNICGKIGNTEDANSTAKPQYKLGQSIGAMIPCFQQVVENQGIINDSIDHYSDKEVHTSIKIVFSIFP